LLLPLVMTSNCCANPECATPLQMLRDGRIFQFEIRPAIKQGWGPSISEKLSRTLSHFWLCGQCSPKWTLVFDQLRGVVVKPLASE